MHLHLEKFTDLSFDISSAPAMAYICKFTDLSFISFVTFYDEELDIRPVHGDATAIVRPRVVGDNIVMSVRYHNDAITLKHYNINGSHTLRISIICRAGSGRVVSLSLITTDIIQRQEILDVIRLTNKSTNHEFTREFDAVMRNVQVETHEPRVKISVTFQKTKSDTIVSAISVTLPSALCDEWYGNFARECAQISSCPRRAEL